jgi:hypothetical protein
MVALLKFLGLAGLVAAAVYCGAIVFNHLGGQAGIRQAAASSPIGAMQDYSEAVGHAGDRTAQSLGCASGDRSKC